MIDSHTHIFPDKIAAKIAAGIRGRFPLSGDFTLKDLRSYMERCGVEAVLTFCVAERPEVVAAANNFLIGFNDNRTIFSFGTILPSLTDPVAEVKRIREKGLKGIKFHSLFQPIGAADENLFPIYEAMAQLEMIAYFHVGKESGDPNPARTGPREIAIVRERVPNLKIVAAHFGGLHMLEESRRWVIGKDVYVDTCWGPNIQSLGAKTVIDLIRSHGAEKVLFATDYPSTDEPAPQIKWFQELPLTEKEKQLIFRENARKLLEM